MSLFGIHLFYTWLAMTPHRRPGSIEVQESLTALAHQGRQGYSATKNTDRHTNGFTSTHTDGQETTQIEKFKVSRQRNPSLSLR